MGFERSEITHCANELDKNDNMITQIIDFELNLN